MNSLSGHYFIITVISSEQQASMLCVSVTFGDTEIRQKYSGCLSGKCRRRRHKGRSSKEADSQNPDARMCSRQAGGDRKSAVYPLQSFQDAQGTQAHLFLGRLSVTISSLGELARARTGARIFPVRLTRSHALVQVSSPVSAFIQNGGGRKRQEGSYMETGM